MASRVQMTGGLSRLDLGLLDASLQQALTEVGKMGVETMRSYTEPYDFRGSLTKSIMWRTRKASGGNEGNDSEISVPEESTAVNIGSANDHAFFREVGTGTHVTSYRTEEFIADLKEWCRAKLGFDPEQPDNNARFWALVKHIRDNGTKEAPFALPSLDIIRYEGSMIIKGNTMRMWKQRGTSK